MRLLKNPIANVIVKWLNAEKPRHHKYPLSDYERICYELKPCDVLLVEGRSRISEVIKLITQSPWSHAALYLGRLHDIEEPDLRAIVAEHYQGDPSERLIIESELGLGTIIHPISIYKNQHLRICRPDGLSYKDSQEVASYAIGRLGLDYDVRQILDLGRLLFPWVILPRRWRSSLFRRHAGKTTKTVCSTMIAEAFGSVHFPILPLVKDSGNKHIQLFTRNPKLCTPSDFDYSPYFQIIKYPFVDFSYHTDYRLLPWKGDAKLEKHEVDEYMTHHDDIKSESLTTASDQPTNTSEPTNQSNTNQGKTNPKTNDENNLETESIPLNLKEKFSQLFQGFHQQNNHTKTQTEEQQDKPHKTTNPLPTAEEETNKPNNPP